MLVIFAGGELDAFTAAQVVHPEFASAQGTRRSEVFAGDDVFAIGSPHAVVDQAEVLFGDLAGVFAVAIHHPGIVTAASIGGEEDFFAIGTKTGLHFKGMPRAQHAGFSALHGQDIDVTQKVESNFFAIGRNVEVHPGAFIGAEGYVFVGAGGIIDVPFFSVLRVGSGKCEGK